MVILAKKVKIASYLLKCIICLLIQSDGKDFQSV